jgi:hypothetical protein
MLLIFNEIKWRAKHSFLFLDTLIKYKAFCSTVVYEKHKRTVALEQGCFI